MSLCNAQTGVPTRTNTDCSSSCLANVCPNFTIKRHDTKPSFKVLVEDCDGPLDLTDETLVLEANMWSKAKLKSAITAEDTYFRLADDIGFEQIMQDDIIIMDRARLPEHMLVTGFDEINKLVRVQRAYHGTTASAWAKGASLRIFRMLNASAEIESVHEDIVQVDGTTLEDQLVETYLVYNWAASDTCLSGCYLLEFKLLKMSVLELNALSDDTPSNISFTPSTLTPADFGCSLGTGVEWVRRFPVNSEGFVISIQDSPTQEI